MNVSKRYNLTPYHIDNLETLAKFLEGDEIPPQEEYSEWFEGLDTSTFIKQTA